MPAISDKYLLKVTNNIVHIQKTYWDEEEPKKAQRHKVKQLVLGRLGEPFFEPADWVKNLLK